MKIMHWAVSSLQIWAPLSALLFTMKCYQAGSDFCCFQHSHLQSEWRNLLIQITDYITLKEIAHIQEMEFGTQNNLEKWMIYDMKDAWCSLTELLPLRQIHVAMQHFVGSSYSVKISRCIVESHAEGESRTRQCPEREWCSIVGDQ